LHRNHPGGSFSPGAGENAGTPVRTPGRDRGRRSAFLETVSIFVALIFFQTIYALFLIIAAGIAGIEPGAPALEDWPRWKLMFSLARASVYEEVIIRIVLIGLPLCLYRRFPYRRVEGTSLCFHGRSRGSNCDHGPPGEVCRSPYRRFLLGGGFRIGRPEFFLVIFSAAVFGLAHLAIWDWWKVPPTFVAGLGFGYLFLRKGLHACIVLHFAVDYLLVLVILLKGLPAGAYFAFISLSALVFPVFFISGAVEFHRYLRLSMRRARQLLAPRPGVSARALSRRDRSRPGERPGDRPDERLGERPDEIPDERPDEWPDE